MLSIVSSRVVSKFGTTPDDPRCEDLVVVSDPYCAVIDGVTSKHALLFHRENRQLSSGRFAAEIVADALRSCPKNLSPREVIDRCSSALLSATYQQRPGIDPLQRPAATIAIVDTAAEIAYSVGDTTISFENGSAPQVHTSPHKLDIVAADHRSAVLAAYQRMGTPWTNDPGREAILPLLRLAPAFANTVGEFGFGVINGDAVPDELISIHSVRAFETVVLSTDGYPDPAPEGRLSLADAERYLARRLLLDPCCVSELRSTKGIEEGQSSFDDRSWLELRR